MIDHTTLLQALASAEARVASGLWVIARQRDAITKLIAAGQSPADAEGMLACYEQAHAIDLASHQLIKDELARSMS